MRGVFGSARVCFAPPRKPYGLPATGDLTPLGSRVPFCVSRNGVIERDLEFNTVSLTKRRTTLFGGTPKRTRETRALPQTVSFLAFLLTFHLSLLTTPAQETVIVPYDASKPLAAQKTDQRYVPYERFMQLWDAAKAHKRGPIPADAPDKYLLNNARYEAVLDAKVMSITATIDLHTFGNHWVEVPIQFGQRQWSGVTIDGAPAASLNDRLIIEKPGAHRVIFTVSEPLLSDQHTSLSMPIPKAVASMVVVTLPVTNGAVTFPNDLPNAERIESGRKIVSALLGGADHLKVDINLQNIAVAPINEPDSAIVRNQITVTPGWERIATQSTFDLAGSSLDHFGLLFPNDCLPVGLTGADIRSWKLTALPTGQRLDVFLNAPATKSYALELITERPLIAGPHATPVITALARRVENRIDLIAGSGMEFREVQPGDARQVESEQPLAGRFATYSLVKSGATIAYETKPVEAKREAKISTIYLMGRRKIEVIASLTLGTNNTSAAENNGSRPAVPTLTDLTIPIPADFDIETVQSSSLRDWWRDANILHLRFNQATGSVPLVLYLVKQFDTAPADLDLFPLKPEGFQTVTGEAVVAAHMGDEAALTLTGSAKQLDPGLAAKDFSILAPLERKRAFTYNKVDFTGKVTLSPLALKLGAAWVTHVQAHEGWLAWQTKVRLVVRQGTTRKASFSLPINLPEARVTGQEVRETSSKVDPKNPKRRLYEVSLQNDLVTETELTIDLEQSADLPVAAVEFEGLERTDGYLVAENVSEYEMSLQAKGLDIAQPADLPFLPPLTTGASLYRFRPGWSLGVKLQRLEKTGSRAAFVAWAEITTAIREDGTEWNRIVWHLQNRSLQFLPVRIPAGGELVGVRVAGQSVRADIGEVDGQKVTLIPLIKTRPGDISYDVEMVWRRMGASKLSWLNGRALDDPDLVGITVERTLWNLYLPKDHPLPGSPDRVGNMDEVIAELNRTEKLSGMLDELKSLNSVVLSRKESSVARVKAKENFDRLARDLESKTAEVSQERDDYEKPPAARRERVLKQKSDVNQLQEQLKSSLAEEKNKQALNGDPTTAVPMQQQQAGERNMRWGNNADYASNGTAVISRQLEIGTNVESGKSQIYFNDGVVLNNIDAKKPAAKSVGKDRDKNMEATSSDALISRAASLELAKKSDDEPQAREDIADIPKDGFAFGKVESSPATENMKLILGSARGNAMNASPAAPDATTSAASLGGHEYAQAADASQSIPGLEAPALDQFEEGGTSNVTVATDNMGAKGRVSLNADFPLEGSVWHFKKLKANARLDFRVGSVPLVERWMRIGWFALAAAGLWGGGRIAKRRLLRSPSEPF